MIQDSFISNKEELFAGRYKIEKLLGSGAAGKVYLAIDNLLEGERVALKVLSSQHLKDETQVKRFLREASLTRKVTHPNVVRTYDAGNHNNILFLSMEYIEGVNLKEFIAEQPLPAEKALRFIADIGKGLVAIHQAEIIHRDLKLNNILVTNNEIVKIADFGVAKHTLSSLTLHEDLIGSATHMAPEVWQSGDLISNASDVYALGVIAYELLTGILPFEGATVMELMWKHTHQEPALPSSVIPDLPLWIDELVNSMLAKDHKSRIQSVEEVIRIIENALQKGEESQDTTASTTELKIAPSATGYQRTNTPIEPQSLLWDPIRVEPSDSSHISLVEEPLIEPKREINLLKSFKSLTPIIKPCLAFFAFIIGIPCIGSYLELTLGNAANLITNNKGEISSVGPLIELGLIAGLSTLPILFLSVFNRETSFKLWISSYIKYFAIYAFATLCIARFFVANGFFSGYTTIKGTMIALSSMQMTELWHFTNLIPRLPLLNELILGAGISPIKTIPWYLISALCLITLAQLLLLSTLVSRVIFEKDDKLIIGLNLFVSIFLTASITAVTIYAKQISSYLGLSLKNQFHFFIIKTPLSEYEFYCGVIHWSIFFILTVGAMICLQSKELSKK